jgi:cell division protein FtsB
MRRGNTWVRWLWLALILYLMYTVGRLAYKNYQFNVEETKLRQDITSLENDIQNLSNQIIYFQSDSYKEKMMRAKLNLQKEGEKVVVITPEPNVVVVPDEKKEELKNPEKWLRYFFGI